MTTDHKFRVGDRICDGSCDPHVGPVTLVRVLGWGEFRYCEAAIEEDRRRGLIVEPIPQQPDAGREEK